LGWEKVDGRFDTQPGGSLTVIEEKKLEDEARLLSLPPCQRVKGLR